MVIFMSVRKEVRLALKAWLKNKSVVSAKQSYSTLQQNFDKLVRRKKRLFLSTQRQELLDLQNHNPRSFWKNVKKLSISYLTRNQPSPGKSLYRVIFVPTKIQYYKFRRTLTTNYIIAPMYKIDI